MRRRIASCGALPVLSTGVGSDPSIVAMKGAFSRKTVVASRRPVPRTVTTDSAPRWPVNGCMETSLGSPGGAGALGAARAEALPVNAAAITSHEEDMRTSERIILWASISGIGAGVNFAPVELGLVLNFDAAARPWNGWGAHNSDE